MNSSPGRYLFALATIGAGICGLVWRDAPNHELLTNLIGSAATVQALIYTAVAVDVVGGIAIFWPVTARAGAVAVGALLLTVTLIAVVPILKHPLVYNSYGNFFEQVSLLAGAVLIYARVGPSTGKMQILTRIAYYAFAVCVISFALEQAFYLSATAGIVPKWIPFGQHLTQTSIFSCQWICGSASLSRGAIGELFAPVRKQRTIHAFAPQQCCTLES
jgi:uncharacterized membrane protein YphA (DoxX/SURF4 family)